MQKHVVQSQAWAEVRSLQGSTVHWFDGEHLLIIKKAPKPFKPVGIMSQVDASKLDLQELQQFGRHIGLSHIQIDPNEEAAQFKFSPTDIKKFNLLPAESLLLRHTQLLDLNLSEEELLTAMHKNWRYNCKYALKQGVEVEFRNDEAAVEDFLKVYYLTVEAKGFLGRDKEYYRQVWSVMRKHNQAVIVLGKLGGRIVVARMLFLYREAVYTAYTGTSRDAETSKSKAAYGVFWEILRWAKANNFHTLNMWGIEPNATENHPHFGFTQFKMGFGGRVVELAPAYDLVLDLGAYRAFQFANFMRLALLRLKNRLLS
jgi:lipid II:glycine glycyltransferase (peptidoglycan interpeptide bridge formation enzyme)